MRNSGKLLSVTPTTGILKKRPYIRLPLTEMGATGKTVIIEKIKLVVQSIVRAGESSVPEKERASLRNFNIIAAVTGLMVIVFGSFIYTLVPSTPFLIALVLESSAFAGLIYLNSKGKYNYSKIGMYLTHCFSAIYFGSWLGEAMPVSLIAAFLLVYLVGSSCQVYQQKTARVWFIVATILLWIVVDLNRRYLFIPQQHFPSDYLPVISWICWIGMMVLMLFVTVNMIQQNDRLAKEAAAASLQKTKYVHETSHELRTPLNTIVGNAELLLDWKEELLTLKDGAVIANIINNLHEGSQIMCDIINNQLDMAKIEAGKFDEVDITDFTLHEILSKSIEQHTPLAKRKNVSIIATYDSQITDIKSDQLFMLKITNNLLSNAIKFTQPGTSVTIATKLDATCMELSFTNVSHLPAGKVATLFKEYSSERNLQAAGTGLGLTITQKLVASLNGTIAVEAGLKQTSFIVRLPYVPADGQSAATQLADDATATAPGKRPIKVKPSPAGRSERVSLDGIKILIAEDDEMNQKLLERMLQQAGAIVMCADTAEGALARLSAFGPDIIISDFNMPGIGGIGLLENLHLMRLHIPVIIASGSTSEEHLKGFKRVGAAGHILKPIDRRILMATISDVLVKYVEIS